MENRVIPLALWIIAVGGCSPASSSGYSADAAHAGVAARMDQILQHELPPEPGDIVLRRGNGFISRIILTVNPEDLPLTHAGIIVAAASNEGRSGSATQNPSRPGGDDRNRDLAVVDILGDRLENRVRRAPLSTFVREAVPGSLCILRFRGNARSRRQIAVAAIRQWKRGYRFDYEFDLKTPETLYCTEQVQQAIHRATGVDINDRPTQYRGRQYMGFTAFASGNWFIPVYGEKACPFYQK